ncbi:MAG: folate-binding protein YgfZ [Rhodospirillales bacterium]|nr:folate-binding protein YgfZ [Alphaproteobacteria bacterium]MCB9981767.1 folate-binding protein YgfZ [Rhodospirillales bacterium]
MEQFFVKLKNRGLIHLEGADRHDFLQGLITNDIEKLKQDKMLYACLLTPQGKFLHDFFILEGKDFTLLDCEGSDRAHDLYERLLKYRLRKDVQISVEEHNDVYATFGSETGLPDPRHPDMGYRTFEKPEDLPEAPFEEWDRRRIQLTIPDGSRDLIPEKSTMDEGNMDRWNAIDYQKGCYIGQELTARMHYRGLGKKHLKTVKLKPSLRANEYKRSNPENWIATSASPPRNDIIELRSTCGDIGIALVKS